MRDGGVMRSDITPGGIFPDYALPDHTATVRTLSELQGRDPLILMLSRGHYCPKEHQQHLDLAAFQSKVAVAYTQMVTISTDEHHTLQEFRASVGAQWTFLSDPGRTIQKDLDIQEYTDPEHDPMIPHTLVLKPGLVIHSIYNGYWFWGRPSVDDLWRDLRAASARDPARLGPQHAGPARGLGRRRPVAIPRMGQAASHLTAARRRPGRSAVIPLPATSCWPPSTSYVAPVSAVLVIRWTASAATSAGPTTRPIGSVARSCSRRASSSSPSSDADSGVSTKPGAIRLTRIGASSSARLAVSAGSAAVIAPR